MLAGNACYQLLSSLLLLRRSILHVRFHGSEHVWLTTGYGEHRARLDSVVYQSVILTVLDLEVVRTTAKSGARGLPVSNRIRVSVIKGSVSDSQRKQLACFLTHGI